MRLNKFFLVTLLALSTTLLQSCLKDQDDVFDESPSERMQATLDNAKQALMNSEYGWAFDYYPDSEIRYGGFVYTVKFDDSNVTVGCELAPGQFESSLYKLTNDNGPILSFDSYNTLMHFFATPSSSNYQGYDGDFEFMILNVSPDLITLKGKRTGNLMYLRPLAQDAESYLKATVDMSESMFATAATGSVGSTPLYCTIYQNDRYMEVSWGEGEDQMAGEYFIPTTTGIRFLAPLQLNGATVETLDFNPDNLTYSGTDSNGNQISLAGAIPDDYAFFDEFEGEFSLKYNNGTRSINVTLEPDKANNRYLIKGLSSAFDVVASFNKSNGCLEINSQQVGVDGNEFYWLCGWALDPATGSGSFSWSTDCGMYIKKDLDNPGTYIFTTNDYTSIQCTSFIVWHFTGTVSSTGSVAGATSPWLFVTGSYQLVYVQSLVKK